MIIEKQSDTKMWVSDDNLIPQEYQNKLIVWRDVFKAGFFEIGDIANELCEYAAQHGFTITQERVFRAVGRFCDRTGRTVRYYAETAVFYPLDVRNEFCELPFSHFSFAKSMDDKWREVLEYAMSHPEISADGLEREFVRRYVGSNDPLVQELKAWENASEINAMTSVDHYADGELVSTDIIRESSQIPDNKPSSSRDAIPQHAIRASHLSALSSLIEVVSRVLFVLKLRDETRLRLESALEDIRKSIPEIADAAEK